MIRVTDVESALTVIEQPGRLPREIIELSIEEKLKLPPQPSTGAIMNLREVLTNTIGTGQLSPEHALFGEKVEQGSDGFDINSYFSELLKWDDEHCYGLQASIYSAQIARGNDVRDKLYGLIWIAAEKWIDSRRTSRTAAGNWYIYCRYPTMDDSDEIEYEKYKC